MEARPEGALDEREKDNGKKQEQSDGCVGELLCNCPDGPGCLAGILFIVLMFAVYGLYYILASTLGLEPVALKDWEKAGTLFWLALAICLAASAYAWCWMEEHWK